MGERAEDCEVTGEERIRFTKKPYKYLAISLLEKSSIIW